jgi:ectoine hydroxylase-related dioxygenase (phytanoyl-CoA dioxygenase family)
MDFQLLTPSQRVQFDQDGYLIVRGALGGEQVAELVAAGDRLIASDEQFDRQSSGGTYDGFRNVLSRGAAFAKLLTHGTTVPLVAQLLSPNLQLHTSHLIYKHPEAPGADPMGLSPGWHRDINTLPADLGWFGNQRMEIKVAYYLSDARPANSGVTMVARGSNHWTTPPQLDVAGNPPDVVLPDLAPGDALLFENRTYHAARLNTSTATRKCVMFGYSYRWMRPDDWLEQPEDLLAQLDDIGRELVSPMRHRDATGRFAPCADRHALRDWATRHGVRGAAEVREQGMVAASDSSATQAGKARS